MEKSWKSRGQNGEKPCFFGEKWRRAIVFLGKNGEKPWFFGEKWRKTMVFYVFLGEKIGKIMENPKVENSEIVFADQIWNLERTPGSLGKMQEGSTLETIGVQSKSSSSEY